MDSMETGMTEQPQKQHECKYENPQTQQLFGQFEQLQPGDTELIAVMIVCIAQIITFIQVVQHKSSNTKPLEQRHILQILYAVPICGYYSWILLNHLGQNSYYDYLFIVKDCFGAYVLYIFVCLCYEYMGGESKIESIIDSQLHSNIESPRTCKLITLQFCFVNPICSFVHAILKWEGLYRDGDWDDAGYVFVTLMQCVSVILAMYGLFAFEKASHKQLQPFEPLLKLLIVASVAFLAFWQELILVILEWNGVIMSVNDRNGVLKPGLAAIGYNNLFICLETLILSVALRYAFPASEYARSTNVTVTVVERKDTMQSTSRLHPLV